jgi:hypothetical protein
LFRRFYREESQSEGPRQSRSSAYRDREADASARFCLDPLTRVFGYNVPEQDGHVVMTWRLPRRQREKIAEVVSALAKQYDETRVG